MHKSDWLGNNPAVRDKKLSTFCYKSNKKKYSILNLYKQEGQWNSTETEIE